MTKPLVTASANDAFSVFAALRGVVDGEHALFVTPPVVGDIAPEPIEVPREVDDDVALIVESSGSTGRPKRIELSRDAILHSARASIERLGGDGQWLLALPTNFIAGLQVLIRSLVSDIQPILMTMNVSFTAEAFIRNANLMTGARRYTSLVPIQLDLITEAAQKDFEVLQTLKRFDAILVGGQAPHMQTVQWLRHQGVNVVITYGMTETSGGCFYDGVALDGVKVSINDNDEILIGGATLANNLGDWFATKDVGFVDDTGRLMVMGRSDRVINSGGLKLSLDLVEEWARTQPGVRDAIAAPLRNEKYGETFVCWVVVDNPEQFEMNAEAAVRDLGRAASVAIWGNLNEMPTLPNGKPDTQSLIASFIEFQESQR